MSYYHHVNYKHSTIIKVLTDQPCFTIELVKYYNRFLLKSKQPTVRKVDVNLRPATLRQRRNIIINTSINIGTETFFSISVGFKKSADKNANKSL